jgi:hypothetical protein
MSPTSYRTAPPRAEFDRRSELREVNSEFIITSNQPLSTLAPDCAISPPQFVNVLRGRVNYLIEQEVRRAFEDRVSAGDRPPNSGEAPMPKADQPRSP